MQACPGSRPRTRAIVGSGGAARRGHKGQNARNGRNAGQRDATLDRLEAARQTRRAARGTSRARRTHRGCSVTVSPSRGGLSSRARAVAAALAAVVAGAQAAAKKPGPLAGLIKQSKGESADRRLRQPAVGELQRARRALQLLLPVDQGHRVRPRRQHDLLEVRIRGGAGRAHRRPADRERAEPLGVRAPQGLRRRTSSRRTSTSTRSSSSSTRAST